MSKNKIINWFLIFLVLHSLLELNEVELCPFVEKILNLWEDTNEDVKKHFTQLLLNAR